MVPASSPLHYFLKIDGVTGDSTVKGFAGWFSVDGFDLGVTTPSSVSAGGGGGAGQPTLSPPTPGIPPLPRPGPLFCDAGARPVIKTGGVGGGRTPQGPDLQRPDVKLPGGPVTNF